MRKVEVRPRRSTPRDNGRAKVEETTGGRFAPRVELLWREAHSGFHRGRFTITRLRSMRMPLHPRVCILELVEVPAKR